MPNENLNTQLRTPVRQSAMLRSAVFQYYQLLKTSFRLSSKSQPPSKWLSFCRRYRSLQPSVGATTTFVQFDKRVQFLTSLAFAFAEILQIIHESQELRVQARPDQIVAEAQRARQMLVEFESHYLSCEQILSGLKNRDRRQESLFLHETQVR